MAIEIERRFLARDDSWRGRGVATPFRQGFLSTVKERVVRVRVAGERATLTIKGATRGVSKLEFEYPIPLDHACQMLDELCEPVIIDKVRHRIEENGLVWEVDEFFGENRGLVLVEVELVREDQPIDLPPWVGREVSDDPRYFNSNLARHPFIRWAEQG